MAYVEKNVQKDPIRIGIGPKKYHETLRTLGCESVMTPDDADFALANGVPAFREDAGDVAVFIDPRCVAPVSIQRLATLGVVCEVAGHAPRKLRSYDDRQAFRALRAKVPGVDVPDGRGAAKVYDVSDQHLDDAIADWHAGAYVDGRWRPDYSRKQIVERMQRRTGLDIQAHWIRDQVIKRHKSAHRNPDDHPKESER